MESAHQAGLEQLSMEHLRHLVEGLNSLTEGESAATMLVSSGVRVIPLVAEFLIRGRPVSVPEPRRRAVRVLADLGAVDDLIRYLEWDKRIADPVLRFSEESVESLAAELLARWPTQRVFDVLLRLGQHRKLIGLCSAFAQLRRPESIPVLIQNLRDGVCGRPAAEALKQMGRVVVPELLAAAITPEMNGETELPASLQKRRLAVRILGQVGLSEDDWNAIRSLSHDDDTEIAARACIAGIPLATEAERILLASRMLTAASNANWLVKCEIQEVLVANYQSLRWVIEQFAKASSRPTNDPSKQLALAIIAAADGRRRPPSAALEEITWFSRVRARLFSGRKRQSDG